MAKVKKETTENQVEETQQVAEEQTEGAKLKTDGQPKTNEAEASGIPVNDQAEKIENLEEALSEAKDKYLRLYSEFDNFRRRTSKERLELIGTANQELMQSLIPVLDDFDRALKVIGDTEKEDNKGIALIYHKYKNILEAKGLKKMEVSVGDDFNDEWHEAITQIPVDDSKMAGKIVDIVEPGYYLSEKVIRFAKVVTGAKS